MARVWFSVATLVLGVSLCWAGGQQAKAESPPVVTLRTVITGTCQEIQRYAESLVGAGVIRSAAEVQEEPQHTIIRSLFFLYLQMLVFFFHS